VIPGRGADRQGSCLDDLKSHEHHQGKEREDRWGGFLYCRIGPLPLGLKAQMGSELLEGDLHIPSHDEPVKDLLGSGLRGR